MGVFTVKSADIIARGLLGRDDNNVRLRNLVWQHLWTAQVIPKNRNRCCHEHTYGTATGLRMKVQHLLTIGSDAEISLAGLGMVARNNQGEVLVSAVMKMEDVPSPLHVEVWAVLFGLTIGAQNGSRNIIVESDSERSIKLISQGADSDWDGLSIF
ncbi:hypothetical protein REPUB_Repub11eG0015600 [Reevesia pubescens]